MALSGNGSVLTRGSAVANVTTMRYSVVRTKIDVSSLASPRKAYVKGLPKRTITATVLGPTAIVHGSNAVTTCTFGVGGSAMPSGALKFTCTQRDQSDGVDQAITTNLSFEQGPQS